MSVDGGVGVSVDFVVVWWVCQQYLRRHVCTYRCTYICMYSPRPLTTDIHSWKAYSSKKSDCQYTTPLSQLGDHHWPFLQQQQQTIKGTSVSQLVPSTHDHSQSS